MKKTKMGVKTAGAGLRGYCDSKWSRQASLSRWYVNKDLRAIFTDGESQH